MMDCAEHKNADLPHCPQCLAEYWKSQHESLRAEVERLKAEADPDGLTIAWLDGAATAKREIESLRAQLAEVTRERDANERLVDRLCNAVLEINNKLDVAKVDAASVWAEGYRQGIEDERTSEANIGIAGFGMKVNPARQNPYAAMGKKQPC